jgi:hypothetical protein
MTAATTFQEWLKRHPEDLKYLALMAQQERAMAAGASLLDIVAPNGKRIADCTGDEVKQIAERLERISRGMEAMR